jgi:hypothetical protein
VWVLRGEESNDFLIEAVASFGQEIGDETSEK